MNGGVADEGAFAASINELFFGPISAERYETLVKTTYGGPAGPSLAPPNYPEGTPAGVLAKYPLSAYRTPGDPGPRWGPTRTSFAIPTSTAACRSLCRCLRMSSVTAMRRGIFRPSALPMARPTRSTSVAIRVLAWRPSRASCTGSRRRNRRSRDNLSPPGRTSCTPGNPNLKGNSPWPRYTKGSEVYLTQNVPHLTTITEAQFRAAHQCDFWDTVLVY